MYDYILVDVDKRLDDVNLGVFEAAETVFVVMTADLSCLKNVRLILETMDHLGYPAEQGPARPQPLERVHRHQRQERRGRAQADDRPPGRQRVPRRDQRAELRRAVHVHQGRLGAGRLAPPLRAGGRQARRDRGSHGRVRPLTGHRAPRYVAVESGDKRRARRLRVVLAIVPSATLHGLDGRVIRVEVDVAPGLPGFTIVGLADAALQEARERVRGALRNAGYTHPPRRITVNLAPADLRKAGASLDLAIAVGILLGSEQVRAGPARSRSSGSCRWAARCGRCPASCRWSPRWPGAGCGGSWSRRPPSTRRGSSTGIDGDGRRRRLREAVEVVQARRSRRAPARPRRIELVGATRAADDGAAPRAGRRAAGQPVPDLAEVRGQVEARRGLEIALAGGHGLLLVGPPGSGKTLLARTIPGLLPPLDDAAALRRRSSPRRRARGRSTACAASRPSAPRTTRCPTPPWSAVARTSHPAR